jgi:hypothetical protein
MSGTHTGGLHYHVGHDSVGTDGHDLLDTGKWQTAPFLDRIGGPIFNWISHPALKGYSHLERQHGRVPAHGWSGGR